MKVIIDRQKVSRRARLANVVSLGGMLILLGSVVLPLFRPQTATLATPMMFAGMLIAMVGIYYANRWIKKPRPEDRLDAALKTLNDSYQLFHYPDLPCDHVLLTPNGVVVLETVNLDGRFSYREGRWKEKMTLSRALRWIVEEHLGNQPGQLAEAADLQGRFAERLPDEANIMVKAVVVFTHPAAQVEIIEEPGAPVVKVEKLKKLVVEKGKRLAPEVYEGAQAVLENKT
jgi:hypothetical protein